MSDAKKTTNQKAFTLPNSLIGGVDLGRLIRELEVLDDFLYQTQIRTPGTSMQIPKTSKTLDEISGDNHYSLLDKNHRAQLLKSLKQLDAHAPVIHMSFAVEASPAFAGKIVAWMRQHIHQYLLVEIGLQPTVSVGCVVRTNNKIFDMSLRNKFLESRGILVKKMAEAEPKNKPVNPVSPPNQAVEAKK
jgi:F0F1-type ATP synthase delta subunit